MQRVTRGSAAPAGPRHRAAPGSPQPGARRPRGAAVLAAGLVLAALTAAAFGTFIATHPVSQWLLGSDLQVYLRGGRVADHIRPAYQPGVAAPLYDWPGTNMLFTYPPFAAVLFAVTAVLPWHVLAAAWTLVSVAALVATAWLTLTGLGYRAVATRAGCTLAAVAVLWWLQPVQRTVLLGQVELGLMALILWDMLQPDHRRWKGIGLGVAAGIKLTPLIFIPYLIITRRYRQAVVAAASFAASVAVGFAVLPADSRAFWLDGLIGASNRTGFTGSDANQSLRGLITRLSGSIAGGTPAWLAAAVLTTVLGLACALVLHRRGHVVPAVLSVAVTGVLVSPVSWDHHWVWIVPSVIALASYALRAGRARYAYLAAAVVTSGLFAAWPGLIWGQPQPPKVFFNGLIYWPPGSLRHRFFRLGDQPFLAEYRWHGWQLLFGNLYVLTGMALFAGVVAVTAVMLVRERRAPAPAAVPVGPRLTTVAALSMYAGPPLPVPGQRPGPEQEQLPEEEPDTVS